MPRHKDTFMDLDSAHAVKLATKLYHNSLLSITSTLITLFYLYLELCY